MGKPKSLTQVFTAKDFPREYVGLLNDLCFVEMGIEDFIDGKDMKPVKVALLKEAIYDLSVKRSGENNTKKALEWNRKKIGLPEPQ
jgi:hypothetical protein